MPTDDFHAHLSRISTMWTMVFAAHGKDGGAAGPREQLLLRYCGAVYRYLVKIMGDQASADEVAQEFALSFLQGKFQHANPDKGRFRDYVKAGLFNLVRQHFNKRKATGQLDSQAAEPAVAPEPLQSDQQFLDGWRDELLARAWDGLATVQKESGTPFHAVLQHKVQHPDEPSAQAAQTLSAQLSKPFSAAGVRQILHRAREKFAEVLLDEIACSVETRDKERVEQEVLDLGLLPYCKDALDRWGRP